MGRPDAEGCDIEQRGLALKKAFDAFANEVGFPSPRGPRRAASRRPSLLRRPAFLLWACFRLPGRGTLTACLTGRSAAVSRSLLHRSSRPLLTPARQEKLLDYERFVEMVSGRNEAEACELPDDEYSSIFGAF